MNHMIVLALLTVIAVVLQFAEAGEVAGARLALLQADRMPRVEGAKEYYVRSDGKANNPGTKEAPWDLTSALRNENVVPGDIIWLLEGTYGRGGPTRFICTLKGTKDKPIIIRGYPGRRVTVDGGIHARGGYTWFWGFEITNSSLVRKTTPANRPPGLNLYPSGNRAINLIIHDTGHPAIGYWRQGDDGEIHGCLVYGCGLYDTKSKPGGAWTRGSGVYAQNVKGTARITDSIWFRNFTHGIKSYAEKGAVTGFHIEGNISFDSMTSSIFAGTTRFPVSNEVVKNNYTYNRPELVVRDNRNVVMGYIADNDNFTMTDNYIVGGNPVLISRRFKKVTMTGNTFYGMQSLLATVIVPKDVAISKYIWDSNTYIRPGSDEGKKHFRLSFMDKPKGQAGPYSFIEWQAKTGLDGKSSFLSVRPKGARVFVRPNRYEVGRGHVAIYNWDLKETVPVDLSSVLAVGARYEVRDAQNYFGPPVVQGRYSGKDVEIPMKLSKVAPPVGAVRHTADRYRHTAPEFAAFVVISGKTLGGQ